LKVIGVRKKDGALRSPFALGLFTTSIHFLHPLYDNAEFHQSFGSLSDGLAKQRGSCKTHVRKAPQRKLGTTVPFLIASNQIMQEDCSFLSSSGCCWFVDMQSRKEAPEMCPESIVLWGYCFCMTM
jgi:hypothetical protein